MVRFFFIESFLSSRRLCQWRQMSKSSNHLVSVPLTLECVRILDLDPSLLAVLQQSPWWCSVYDCYLSRWYCSHLSSCDKPSNLLQQDEIAMSFNLILKIKIVRKYFIATFWFWSIKIWYLNLSIQAQTLKAVIQN